MRARMVTVIAVMGCGSKSPAPAPPPVPRPTPQANLGTVDVTARVDLQTVTPGIVADVRDRCLTTAEVAQRRAALTAVHERALTSALGAAGLRPVSLETAWDRREGDEHVPAQGPNAVSFHEPWTEVELRGARWIIGPSDQVHCGLDRPDVGDARFVTSTTGEVYRLDVRTIATSDVAVRACAVCPDGSGMCGAYMPAMVQIRWKLPEGASFAGHKVAAVEGPVLQAPMDAPARPCPAFTAPP